MAGSAGRRYIALDSLRGLCACFVVLFHLQVTGGIAAWPIFRSAWLLVDFFFVLSGFVIMASYGRRLADGYSPFKFMVLRLGRVYPVHLVVIGAYVAVELASLILHLDVFTGRPAFTGSQSLSALAQSLGLVQIFGFQDATTWNGPSWSIAAEIWTYLIVAMGLSLMGLRFLFVIAGTVIAAPFVLAQVGHEWLDWTYSWSLLRCLYGFGLGMLAYELLRSGRGRLPRGTVTEIVAALACLIGLAVIAKGPVEFAMPPLFALTILVFAAERGRLSRALHAAPMQALGRWSYSIYMVHLFVITRTTDVLKLAGQLTGADLIASRLPNGAPGKLLTGPAWLQSVEALAVLGIVIALAAICYRFVEEPARIASRRWVNGRHEAAVRAKGTVAPPA